VKRLLSVELLNLSAWLKDNKLSRHLGKTESIIFGARYKLRKSLRFRVVVGNVEITAKEVVTYLGLYKITNYQGCLQPNKLSQR
jgi:hypothetical protein